MSAHTQHGDDETGRLIGRHRECGTLDRLIDAVRAGESRVLVVHGEPGVGKTALLNYLAGRARGLRMARVAGVQSEMELAFAGLHQLCAPMLDHADRIPVPQRDALRTALGRAAGPPPDRFLVGLAVLSLLSEVAGEGPLIGVIDDEQWLDQASAQALGFAARRLGADPAGLVFASREPGPGLAGLPKLDLAGLGEQDAQALLDSVLTGPLDPQVRDLIVAETHGNPLALLELPRGLSSAQLAGGFGLLGAQSGSALLAGRIEESFVRQLAALPAETRRLLQLTAADPSGDRSLIWRAAGRLGIPVQAAAPAEEAGLAEFAAGARFRHPLVRSAAYRSAPTADRQELHAALAEVTDPITDPDRRAWHRAQAAAGPDEDVAAELEQSAGRAQARGGLAAAAAFLEHALQLTADPSRNADRALAAARASMLAGAFGRALHLLAMTEAGGTGRLDELTSARVDLLRGQIAFAASTSGDAPALLVKAAKRLEPLDIGLARQTYLEAWAAAYHAGGSAGAGRLLDVARAVRSAPPPQGVPSPSDLLLDALAVLITDGRAAAAPLLRRAAQAFDEYQTAVPEGLLWAWLATQPAMSGEDDKRWHAILARQLQSCREAGLLAQLVIYLNAMAQLLIVRGDFPAAAALIAEAATIAAATGSQFVPYAAMMLAAHRGVEAEAAELIDAVIADARTAGQGHGIGAAHRASSIMYLGLGRYELARDEAQQAAAEEPALVPAMLALPELIEAASRTGQRELAADALRRLTEATIAAQGDWWRGVRARCQALLADGGDGEGWYREAIDRLSRSDSRPELARAYLLYGEWLRREGRRTDAREQLRTAHEMFDAIGMDAFAERARHELLATGETVRKRAVQPRDQLTPQEAQITQLAREGLSNAEISARLFLSIRTVEWHLRKVFIKLDISSRRQLRTALDPLGRDGRPT
jgi:DNA-binding CsgD family transcriptional regulator/tetratricopeptide (TPR) repeat protein